MSQSIIYEIAKHKTVLGSGLLDIRCISLFAPPKVYNVYPI